MSVDRTDQIYRSEIDKAAKALIEGKVVLYPTDSLWGIGCMADSQAAINEVFEIKGRPTNKSMITLVSNEGMLQNVVKEVPELAWDMIELSEKPLTLVYPQANTSYVHLSAEDGTIGVRLIGTGFAHDLIQKVRRPLISTSANFSGQPSPKGPYEVDDKILDKLGYAVEDLGFPMTGIPSKVIGIDMDGTVKIFR